MKPMPENPYQSPKADAPPAKGSQRLRYARIVVLLCIAAVFAFLFVAFLLGNWPLSGGQQLLVYCLVIAIVAALGRRLMEGT